MTAKLIAEESPGIFNWALYGCATWQGAGLVTPSAAQPATAVPALSVGDQATAVPPHLRSIGDEETRA